jgi:AcrR family transcriptional regulator
MGHREDLLDGAKRCLLERGWARTTARDIVTASGTNLASIGYHYGSKEALLSEALIAATGDWAQDLERALGGDGSKDFAAVWDRAADVFARHRGLWTSTFEALADGSPAVREHLRAVTAQAHEGLAELFGAPPGTGATLQALLLGWTAQQLIDPERAPTGAQLEAALRELSA